jgi:hypothetical protein
MFAIVERLLNRAYAMSEARVLLINVALAVFVSMAHGGALVVAQSQASPQLGEIGALAKVSLPLCGVVIFSTLAILVRRSLLPRVLAVHAVVLAVSALWLFVDALDVLLFGVPDGDFVWSVGLFSAWIAYATVVVLRFLGARAPATLDRVHFVPAYALLLAMVVDFGVLLRVLSSGPAI